MRLVVKATHGLNAIMDMSDRYTKIGVTVMDTFSIELGPPELDWWRFLQAGRMADSSDKLNDKHEYNEQPTYLRIKNHHHILQKPLVTPNQNKLTYSKLLQHSDHSNMIACP